MRLFELIFVDPKTAAFAAFYLPFLAILLLLTRWHGQRSNAHYPCKQALPGSGGIETGRSALSLFARLDITPNQVSYIGLCLVLANCAMFLVHHNTFWLGGGLALSYLFDALDGVVARLQGSVSPYGGYLDAVGDRYQEVATLFVLGCVIGRWPLIFAALSGSVLTSYNKARVALEMPTDNKGWPDLLSRTRRLWLLCFGLMGDASVPWLLIFCIGCLAVMSHFTAIQRFLRARWLLLQSSSNDRMRARLGRSLAHDPVAR